VGSNLTPAGSAGHTKETCKTWYEVPGKKKTKTSETCQSMLIEIQPFTAIK
jgi:hypothetical protein